MKRNSIIFVLFAGIPVIFWCLIFPLVNNYVRLPEVGYLGLLAVILLSTLFTVLINSLRKKPFYTGVIVVIIASVIGTAFSLFLNLATYPSIAMMSPAYKEASNICASVKGMPYAELKQKYADKFLVRHGVVQFDSEGNAELSLKNDVWQLDTRCMIKITNSVVTRSEMLFVWL